MSLSVAANQLLVITFRRKYFWKGHEYFRSVPCLTNPDSALNLGQDSGAGHAIGLGICIFLALLT